MSVTLQRIGAWVVLVLMCLIVKEVPALETCRYQICSGSKELSGYALATQICRDTSEVVCVRETNGSLENIYSLLNEDNVIAGLVQGDIVLAAAQKKKKKLDRLRIVLPVKRELVHIIVRNESDIHSFTDLGNKVISSGKPSSGTYITSLFVKKQTHTPWIDAKENFSKGMKLLDRRSVDAVFALSTPPITSLEDKIGSEYRLIEVPGISGYETATIKAYRKNGGEPIPIRTIAVDTLLLVEEMKIVPNTRLANKLSVGVASVLQTLPPQLRDDVCSLNPDKFGMAASFLTREACRLGYYGKDW